MPFCTTCGTANSEQAKFCAKCGAALPRRPEPITVFYSYSHKDEDLRNELEAHLAPLRRSGLIREWNDRKIIAGQDWDKEISRYLESAELILFLISADFINSSYIFDVEVKRALERQNVGQAVVVPIILRPVVWRIIPELGRLQALPEGALAVTEWPSQDLAFVSVCEGIVALVLARASSAVERPAPRQDVVSARRTTSRDRRRVLDAALPARVPLTKPSTLLVLIRRTDSPGLRAIVEAEPEYDISARDIDSQPLSLKFPVDKDGTPQALDLSIRIESPQFEPPSQRKSIKVPPRGDSLPRLFFLTPTQVGPLLVSVEICHGYDMIAGCLLHAAGVAAAIEPEELVPPQNVASTPLEMSSDEEAVDFTAIFEREGTANGLPGEPPPPPARISRPKEVAAPHPASDRPAIGASCPVPASPTSAAGPPRASRLSFSARPLYWLTGIAAVLFIVVIGGNDLMKMGSGGGALSAPIPVAGPVLWLIAIGVVLFVVISLKRR